MIHSMKEERYEYLLSLARRIPIKKYRYTIFKNLRHYKGNISFINQPMACINSEGYSTWSVCVWVLVITRGLWFVPCKFHRLYSHAWVPLLAAQRVGTLVFSIAVTKWIYTLFFSSPAFCKHVLAVKSSESAVFRKTRSRQGKLKRSSFWFLFAS